MDLDSLVGRNLYTIDSNDNVRFWRMEIDGDKYRSVSGVKGGAEVASEWTVAKPKNKGRANATTAEEQALAEVRSHYQKKLDRKYHADENTVGRHKFIAPMLAEKYAGWTGPCWTQPKLDGIRCIATKNGLTSRAGKPFVLKHITDALKPIFDEYPDLILDGELYNHELKDDFNTIVSYVKKQNRDEEQEALCASLVQYHVYDMVEPGMTFFARHDLLVSALIFQPNPGNAIHIVDTAFADTEEELDRLFGIWAEDGYEGQMVRHNDTYEIGKRSKSLLKRKEFQDSEFIVRRVEEGKGNWSGLAKRAILELGDGTGRLFGAGIKGNKAFASDLLENWRKYEAATVRFFALTPDGIPRFGVVTAWHESLENRE